MYDVRADVGGCSGMHFHTKYPAVEWKKIAGLRDKLIHHYFGINWDIVWDVIKNKLPDLGKEIRILIEKEYGG